MNTIYEILKVFIIAACVLYNIPPFTYFWTTMRMILISLIYIFTTKNGIQKVRQFWNL